MRCLKQVKRVAYRGRLSRLSRYIDTSTRRSVRSSIPPYFYLADELGQAARYERHLLRLVCLNPPASLEYPCFCRRFQTRAGFTRT